MKHFPDYAANPSTTMPDEKIAAFRANLGCCPDSGQIIRPSSTRHHLELRSWHRHRLSRASPTCTALTSSPIAAAASSSLPGLLLGAGLFLLGFAACIFVVAAVPAILVRLFWYMPMLHQCRPGRVCQPSLLATRYDLPRQRSHAYDATPIHLMCESALGAWLSITLRSYESCMP